jgi:hypothetical protein
MATIEFKAKAETVKSFDGEYLMIKMPVLKHNHCDMNAFRKHARYGGLANSDLFGNALTRIARDVAPAGFIRSDRLPANVTLDLTGFLARVTIEV